MVGVANGLVETVSLPDLRVRELPTWLLSQAHLRAHRILQERLAAVDARGHHVRVLSALQEHGPLPQVHIGSHAALDRGDLSIAVDELAAAGFVVHPLLGTVGVLLAVRAAVVPRRWPRATPKAIGIGEIVATTAVAVVTLAVL